MWKPYAGVRACPTCGAFLSVTPLDAVVLVHEEQPTALDQTSAAFAVGADALVMIPVRRLAGLHRADQQGLPGLDVEQLGDIQDAGARIPGDVGVARGLLGRPRLPTDPDRACQASSQACPKLVQQPVSPLSGTHPVSLMFLTN